MSSGVMQPIAGLQNPRKRPRAARACELCRAKKYKCNECQPCSQCLKNKSTCVYEGAESMEKRLAASVYVTDLEKHVELLSNKLKSIEGKSGSPVTDATHPGNEGMDNTVVPLDVHESRTSAVHRLESGRTVSDAPFALRYNEEGMASDSDFTQEADPEVLDVNYHTRNVEYHGRTSSMAFLTRVQPQSGDPAAQSQSLEYAQGSKQSLVSTLHNISFSPDPYLALPLDEDAARSKRYHFRQSRIFIDGYFENLHFVHPILSKENFLTRCESLWFEQPEKQPRSFVALYYSILSLGALMRTWDEHLIEGLNRFQWSRTLFDHARRALGDLRSTTDLDTVQSYIFMAKICQNHLNPNLAYMYLGMAVRSSLSAGYNREPLAKLSPAGSSEVAGDVSKTWWGLFSLEVETSFALGRPDTLGVDQYHNQRMPELDDSETAILNAMVDFALIIRKVSIALYLSKSSIREKISAAERIHVEMNSWLQSLPYTIRPYVAKNESGSRIINDPKWARRQRLVLQMRFLNVKMVLYRPFLIYASNNAREIPLPLTLTHAISSCVEAAKETIETMHDYYRTHVFFRTWWYNTTYVLYAASIILSYAMQAAPTHEKTTLFRLVEMTIEILDIMNESIVAKRAAEMIKQALSHAQQKAQVTHPTISAQQASTALDCSISQYPANDRLDFTLDDPMPTMHSMYMDNIFDLDDTFAADESQFLIWTDLNDAASGFGA